MISRSTRHLSNLFYSANLPKQRLFHINLKRMKDAHLRYESAAEDFQVSLRYKNEELGIERDFNFKRKMSENVSDFLGRINSSFDKVLAKKLKKTKKRKPAEGVSSVETEPDSDINAKLIRNGEVVPGTAVCRDVIIGSSGTLLLCILGTEYSLIVNAPLISALSLPCSIMAEFPVYPTKIDISFANKEECIFSWYKNRSEKDDGWIEAGSGYTFIPSPEDIGCWIKLQCVPVKENRKGPMMEAISKSQVEAGPGVCPFQSRQQFTKDRLSGNEFRAVSYNILADLYADSEVAHKELYPYCPSYALHIDYRKQLFMKEIIGYNADLICLQEVDTKVFDLDLQPVLAHFGYEGVFHEKAGTVREGIACFFHTSKFQLVETHSRHLAEELKTNPLFSDLWETIKNHEPLVKRFTDRNTCVQMTVLDSVINPGERLVVGNTHFYFHPNADHIRLLQGGMTVRYLEAFAASSAVPGKRVTALMCGDFNSTPECGVFQLMTTKYVGEDCIDWTSTPEESVKGVCLSHSLSLASACGTPEFTNFTAGFAGCLDYIFYQQDHVDVTQVIPLPDIEEVTLHTALPSVIFPSDHISLVADLKWKSNYAV